LLWLKGWAAGEYHRRLDGKGLPPMSASRCRR
jgi:hypothetical protein